MAKGGDKSSDDYVPLVPFSGPHFILYIFLSLSNI
jgi:hypothetical protein